MTDTNASGVQDEYARGAFRSIEARLDALEAGSGGSSSDSITTGAAPVAADPESAVTLVTTGGTQGTETITLALPASPASKVGRTKRFVIAARGHLNDVVDIDPANLCTTEGDEISTAFIPNSWGTGQAGSFIEMQLVYNPIQDPAVYSWQPVRMVLDCYVHSFANTIQAIDGASTAGEINIKSGTAEVDGSGGALNIRAGNGTTGGDVNIRAGSASSLAGGAVNVTAGDGFLTGGNVVITPTTGDDTDGNVFINNMPAADPTADGALYTASNTVKRSAG